MSGFNEPRLTVDELARLLEATDPAALLVAPRLLRRIIKHDRKLTHLGLQVPHRKSYVIDREALLALATVDELGVRPQRALPATVFLLSRPEPETLNGASLGQTLLKYWRLLFHARVHEALAGRFKDSRVTEAAVRRRIHRIGQTEFAEIRTVLRQERYLLPPHDERTVYEEFVALYLELSFFEPPLLPRYFPAIEDFGRIRRILAEDVDAEALFAATHLAGASDPVIGADESEADEPARPATETLIWTGSDRLYQALAGRADRAAAVGNDVRAAICLTRAARVAPPLMIREAQDRALAEVGRLVERLTQPLHLAAADVDVWRQALAALLSQAAEGIWPAEARLLYDLQKICVDHERTIFAPDVVEWVYSGLRRPLVRPLPNQPLVLAIKHLRLAVGRLPSARVTDTERQVLSGLLHDALHHAEVRLRECFRPPISEALDRVGLQPENFPERLGRSKLIEELLDRITERGFLNMSDLRDALARNQLKLHDLSGPGEFFRGDPLIRVNRELAVSAAGVYRRGEIYLRWLQRGGALAFGTRPGRWFMRFFVLPFFGAFATIVFAQEMLHLVHYLMHGSSISHHLTGPTHFIGQTFGIQALAPTSGPAASVVQTLVAYEFIDGGVLAPHHLGVMFYLKTTSVLGIFYLLMIHATPFRHAVLRCLQMSWRVMRALFVDLPSAFLGLPAVRFFLDSGPFLFLVRFVLKPLPLAVLMWVVLGGLRIDPQGAVPLAGALFVVVSLFLNSRLGRDLEEAGIDFLMRNWDFFRGLWPGLFRLVLNLFKTILEAIDRFLYTVDEWLRFRGGEGRLALALKVVLGFVWFLVTYVVRLYVNVFIEPTVNPIKHFPIVTVVAKFLVPFWPVLLGTPRHPGFLGAPFEFLGPFMQFIMANVILHSLPGAAGFILWEFKEDWRLYRANRPKTLRPEMVGHHGETMLRLMKPGFHSGTLPKLYAKLRRAERKAYRGGAWKPVRRLRETLHHVEESIRHFTERELVAFLMASKGWTAGPVQLVAVEAGSNRVRLELTCQPFGKETLELSIEEQAGWLLAHVARSGWLRRLSGEQIGGLTTALLGFYQKAGVDLVREQIERCFVSGGLAHGSPLTTHHSPPYDIGDEGLIVWPGHGYETEVIYDLREEPVLHPHLKEGRSADKLPVLVADQLFFSKQPISWDTWVAAWERDQAGVGDPQMVLPQVRVLPEMV